MKRKKLWYAALSCLSGVLLMSGCSDNDMTIGGEREANGLHSYKISADISCPKSTPQTRSLSEGQDQVVHSQWEKNDAIIAYNLSDNDQNYRNEYSLLRAEKAGKQVSFEGDFMSVNPIQESDELCFFYPGEASVGDDKSIIPVSHMKGDGKENPFDYYERQNTIKRMVELNVSNQDGTVETIGKKFDYQWAKTTPISVSGEDVKVKVGHMQRKVAIWGLRFADEDGHILTDIDSVSISNVKASEVFDLGKGEFITDNPFGELNSIMITPKSGKLTSADGKYTYVAMLPGTYHNVWVMAYVGNICYATSYQELTFEEDKVYRTNVLGMTEVNPDPYVEVQGVNWATGNFIHYRDSEYGDYWGIAPAQWWISDYAVEKGSIFVSSQFINGYTQSPNDLDLFRPGDIANALELNKDVAKTGTNLHISKKFFSTQTSLIETTQDKAKFGDIVWYYTNKDNQKYRMATDEEFKRLYNEANVIPGFCYTNKGNKVYGAYFFTNNGEERVKTFPTGAKKLYKYSNVSSLVRANQGLFLPIAGMRANFSSEATQRNMGYISAYGQYMTDYSRTSGLQFDFFFGPTEWNFSPNGSGQARAIRPVWDEESDFDQPNPVYKPFSGIW